MEPVILENRSENSKTHLNQLASVGQIAAGIAHEVRNPLTAVKGFLQLLQQEEENQYITIAQSELDDALTTLNTLLQVSKPDLEDEEYQTIFLAVELESILNLFQDKMYDITFITELNDTNASTFGAKNQFKKALFNIIKNAIESIEEKGTIYIKHIATDSEVIVTIKDTGCGIPEDKLQLLGTPFFTTKDSGTGMGLTQVFSAIYQNGGKIDIQSIEQHGTTFTITIPKHNKIKKRGVKTMNLYYETDLSINEFFFKNRGKFEERLLDEATNVRDKIEEIQKNGSINLLENAHKLVLFIVEEKEHQLVTFAKQEGVAWAKYSLTVAFKLEWVQAIRRTLWDFLYNFDLLQEQEPNKCNFYTMEKNINELVDQFLNHFFLSYSRYKDELLAKQRELVDNLSVPIIPINQEICILPLIGTIDKQRLLTIQDKVLYEIETNQIQTLIVDLSGVASMQKELTKNFSNIIDGILMMGCKTVLTGLRSEMVKGLINSGMDFRDTIQFKGTLQLALNDLVLSKESH